MDDDKEDTKEPENPNVPPEVRKIRSNISFLQSLERPHNPPPQAKKPHNTESHTEKEQPCPSTPKTPPTQ